MIDRSAKLAKYALAGIVVGSVFGGCKRSEPVERTINAPVKDPQRLSLPGWQARQLIESRIYRGGEICVDRVPVEIELTQAVGDQKSYYHAMALELLRSAKGKEFIQLSKEQQVATVGYLAGKIEERGVERGHRWLGFVEQTPVFLTGYRALCAGQGGAFPEFIDLGLSVDEVETAIAKGRELPIKLELLFHDPATFPVAVKPGETRISLVVRANGEIGDKKITAEFNEPEAIQARVIWSGRAATVGNCPVAEGALILELNLSIDAKAKEGKKRLTLMIEGRAEPLLVVDDFIEILKRTVTSRTNGPAKCSSYDENIQGKMRAEGKCAD